MKGLKVRVEAVVFNENKELLLAMHQKNGESYWVLPGGKIEYGENMQEALLRELKEELGIQRATVQELVYVDEYISEKKDRHIIMLAFRVDVPKVEQNHLSVRTSSEAIKDIQFFTPFELNESKDVFYSSKELLLKIMDYA